MNTLPYLRQRQIIHLLCEGNSIRSTERLTGVHRDTIMRLVVRVGGKCKDLLDAKLRRLKLRHVQADEIWTFVGCKQERLADPAVIDSPARGDQYLYVAFDTDTKLIATYAIGKRNLEVTKAFMADLADRIITEYPQLSTDGFNAYENAVKASFGDEVAYGQIIKDFAEPVQPGRYGPPVMVAAERKQILGLTDIDLFRSARRTSSGTISRSAHSCAGLPACLSASRRSWRTTRRPSHCTLRTTTSAAFTARRA